MKLDRKGLPLPQQHEHRNKIDERDRGNDPCAKIVQERDNHFEDSANYEKAVVVPFIHERNLPAGPYPEETQVRDVFDNVHFEKLKLEL